MVLEEPKQTFAKQRFRVRPERNIGTQHDEGTGACCRRLQDRVAIYVIGGFRLIPARWQSKPEAPVRIEEDTTVAYTHEYWRFPIGDFAQRS